MLPAAGSPSPAVTADKLRLRPLRNVWILCGGPSTEHNVSLSSGKVVCERINLETQRVRPVVVTRAARWLIADRQMEGDADREMLESFFADASASKSDAGV